MASEWKCERFVRMAHLVRRGVKPQDARGLPYIALEHIGEGTLALTGLGVAEDATSTKTQFARGDILFGKLRPYFRKVVRAPFDGVCSTDIWVVRPQSGVDAGFLFYLMASELFIEPVVRASEGTKMPRAQWEYAASLELPLPPLSEQRAIAHILGTLDDKIELNRKMNQTLEALAQTEFQRMMPKGGKSGRFEELAALTRETINPSDFPHEIFDHYSIPAFDEGRWPKQELGEQIKSSKLLLPKDCVMISKLNPRIPRIWLPDLNPTYRSVASTEFLVAIPKPDVSREYLYALFASQEFLRKFAAMVTGTSGSHQRVKPEHLLTMEVKIPPKALMTKYTNFAKPLLSQIALIRRESRTLAALRDALLPKLISGEIRVRDAERFLKERGL